MIAWRLLILLSALVLVQLAGCATYGSGVQQALTAVEEGDYAKAATQIQSSLSADGKDRLLYNLELGVVRHLEGNYAESNRLLEDAARISEALKKKQLRDSLMVMMSNPRNADYAGNTHEEMMIYYYKALNYLAIAGELPPGNARLDAVEGARIESRRLLLRLQALRNNEGSYNQYKDKEERTFSKVMDVFSVLVGNLVDTDDLTYRDDALAHYLTGVSFEMNEEYDNARISYLKAAESYESGYSEQFQLGNGMAQQAWFDVARMMRRSGFSDNETAQVTKGKLSETQRTLLDSVADKSQLLVIEHKGRVPEKKELNLQLSINPNLRALELQPYFFEYSQEEINWFYLLYADKMFYGLVADYLNATRNFRVDFFTKTIFLGPLYDTAESMGLTNAIGSSLRVAVPYYGRPLDYGQSLLTIDQQTWALDPAASPQLMAIQEQMKNAGPEIRAALSRAAVKAITAAAIGSQDSTGILAFAGKLAAQLSDAAETRSWLLLPGEIQIRRLFLEPGDHTLTLDSHLTDNNRQQTQKQVSLKPGDIQLWTVRTTGANQARKALPKQNETTPETTPQDGTPATDSAPKTDKPTRRLPTKE
ncbi:MAG: hypothetical protein CMH97_02945 [Oceanospirillaceae bacterium]|uniref:hypothetical protein n=1 Tax=unclassified Thalassolituus TaxID=2624967 RepID=UPI000B74B73A|nr:MULTISPECIES: hypothetical protein [unclassified Thalassolituus]MAE34209.1 hypothetical protein [Oceanospirillaceae bacterium]OUX66503.1 MAG: hypothetical protein CBE36_02365 [Oceanospirillaceae bacterium TMED276]MBN58165.1 hypothetical protein [Oceanospirillaceae bacterium]MDQ4423363.1 hypothetical protein [Thalassolituus sp.]MDQ4427140.1 hypothetical protein [Thalassolituus sp.]